YFYNILHISVFLLTVKFLQLVKRLDLKMHGVLINLLMTKKKSYYKVKKLELNYEQKKVFGMRLVG
ncbi:hypothetical protein, partial [Lactobacillus johnsonii]|uniref:hypothetical protein n=1 Tax=Lactobacillus johnsonii TaxID=33959 RepID=UPI001B354FF2